MLKLVWNRAIRGCSTPAEGFFPAAAEAVLNALQERGLRPTSTCSSNSGGDRGGGQTDPGVTAIHAERIGS
jgi:hypothetical protein